MENLKLNEMTYTEKIEIHIKTIEKQIGSISVITHPGYAKVTINGEEWISTEDNVLPVLEAYLWGVICGYMQGLHWARKTINEPSK